LSPKIQNAEFSRGFSTMSNVLSYALRSFQRKRERTSADVDAVFANAAEVTLGAGNMQQAFEMPGQLFEQLPFAIYVWSPSGEGRLVGLGQLVRNSPYGQP
jgi:hypothetical protein